MIRFHWERFYTSRDRALAAYFSGIIGTIISIVLVIHIVRKFKTVSDTNETQTNTQRTTHGKCLFSLRILIIAYFALCATCFFALTVLRTIAFVGQDLSCILSELPLLAAVFARLDMQMLFYRRLQLVFANIPNLMTLGTYSKITISIFPIIIMLAFVFYMVRTSALYGYDVTATTCDIQFTQYIISSLPSIVSIVGFDIALVGLFVHKLIQLIAIMRQRGRYSVSVKFSIVTT